MFDYRRAWKLDGWTILFGFESNIQTSSWYLEHIWIFWTIGIYWGIPCTVLDALDIWMSELFKIQPSWQEWRHLHHGGKIPTCLASWWGGFCSAELCTLIPDMRPLPTCSAKGPGWHIQWPTFFDGCSDLCNLWWLARAPSRDFQEPSVREARINLTWRWITKHNQVDGCPLCGPGNSRMPLTPSLCWCHQSYQTKSETFDNFDFVEHWWSVPMLRFTGASKMMFAYMVALFPKCKTPQGVPWPFWASTIEGNSCSSLLFSSVKLNTLHMREMEGEYCPKQNIYFQNTNTTPAVSCFFFLAYRGKLQLHCGTASCERFVAGRLTNGWSLVWQSFHL